MAKRIRVHIGAPDGVAGVFEFRADQPTMATAQSLSLLFTDHLGSVDLSVTIPGSSFLDFSGSATRQKFSYDAWAALLPTAIGIVLCGLLATLWRLVA